MLKLLIGCFVFLGVLVAWKFQTLPTEIPFIYANPWGEAQLADVWYLVTFPLLMGGIYWLNDTASKRYFSDEPVLKKVITVSTVLFIVGYTLIMARLLMLVA